MCTTTRGQWKLPLLKRAPKDGWSKMIGVRVPYRMLTMMIYSAARTAVTFMAKLCQQLHIRPSMLAARTRWLCLLRRRLLRPWKDMRQMASASTRFL